MRSKLIAGKRLDQWRNDLPLLKDIMDCREVFWANTYLHPFADVLPTLDIREADVREASERLDRFAPYLARVFPETAPQHGRIESPLLHIPQMREALEGHLNQTFPGPLLLKCDHQLPISGSIKARGGIYEVLQYAEKVALENGMLTLSDDYAQLDTPQFQHFFQRYSLAVGSTGNLGLSIGIMGAQLGFSVTVHMSADAREWKKQLLREKGVEVVEYAQDYSKAVDAGRRQAAQDPLCHFVDDENSKHLFMGYAVAAQRLAVQLRQQEITVDASHPLLVFLPCGVGGGPGGVSFGLKLLFGDAVRCYFAEPTHAPAMLLGLMTKQHNAVSASDFGLDNRTAADGLAVARPSGFVGKQLQHVIDGLFTVDDAMLYRYLALLADTEGQFLEPSALAGMHGIQHLASRAPQGAAFLVWGTGGSMVPEAEMQRYYQQGKELLGN